MRAKLNKHFSVNRADNGTNLKVAETSTRRWFAVRQPARHFFKQRPGEIEYSPVLADPPPLGFLPLLPSFSYPIVLEFPAAAYSSPRLYAQLSETARDEGDIDDDDSLLLCSRAARSYLSILAERWL